MMNFKELKELIDSIPDTIQIYGEIKNGALRFETDEIIDAGLYSIEIMTKGHQEIEMSTGEESVGIFDGWDVDENEPVFVNFVSIQSIYKDDEEIKINQSQKNLIIREISTKISIIQ